MINLSSPQILSYIPYSDVFPIVKPKIEYFQKRIKDFDFTQIVLTITKLNLLLSDLNEARSIRLQKELCHYFLNDYTRGKVFNKMDKYSLVFNRHQLLLFLKNAFLNCEKVPGTNFQIPKIRYNLGTCCLIANNFLPLVNIDEKKLDSLPIDETKEFLFKELLPSYELYNSPELNFNVARLRIKLDKLLYKLNNTPSFMDINKLFEDFTSLSINEYMALIFAVLTLYRDRRQKVRIDPNAIFIEEKNFATTTGISSEKIGKLFDLISIPIEKFKIELNNSKDKDLNFGFLVFKKYPLAQVNNQKYICIDYHFLLEKLSNGIFWLINERLKNKDRENFYSFWGTLFEAYVKFFLENTYSSEKNIFSANPLYDDSNDEVCDGILDYDEDIVLLEYKFSILKQDAKYNPKISQLIKEIKLKFEKNQKGEWKGYGQLANTINKIFSKGSKRTCRHIFVKKIKRVFPVLITYEHFFDAPFVNYWFNKNFRSLLNTTSILKHIEIKPLIVMTIEDFEKSQPFLKKATNLFLEKYEFDPKLNLSFSDFLVKKYQENPTLIPELIHKEFRKYAEEVRQALFGAAKKRN